MFSTHQKNFFLASLLLRLEKNYPAHGGGARITSMIQNDSRLKIGILKKKTKHRQWDEPFIAACFLRHRKKIDPSNCLPSHILDNPVLSWFYCFSLAGLPVQKTLREGRVELQWWFQLESYPTQWAASASPLGGSMQSSHPCWCRLGKSVVALPNHSSQQ